MDKMARPENSRYPPGTTGAVNAAPVRNGQTS